MSDVRSSQLPAEWEARGFEYGVIHWRSLEAGQLYKQLLQTLPLTIDQLQELVNLGAVYNETSRLTDWAELEAVHPASHYLRLHTKPRRYEKVPDLAQKILVETEDFLVIDKPAGWPCHAMVDNRHENLLSYLMDLRQEKLYITHRLDIGTEGLWLVARTPSSQRWFNQLVSQGQVHKTYSALLGATPSWSAGETLVHHMEASPRVPKVMSREPGANTQECRLQILEVRDRVVDLKLLTGRTHQIRAQLAFEGFPLWGDQLYGGSKEPNRFFLRSTEICFENDSAEPFQVRLKGF